MKFCCLSKKFIHNNYTYPPTNFVLTNSTLMNGNDLLIREISNIFYKLSYLIRRETLCCKILVYTVNFKFKLLVKFKNKPELCQEEFGRIL